MKAARAISSEYGSGRSFSICRSVREASITSRVASASRRSVRSTASGSRGLRVSFKRSMISPMVPFSRRSTKRCISLVHSRFSARLERFPTFRPITENISPNFPAEKAAHAGSTVSAKNEMCGSSFLRAPRKISKLVDYDEIAIESGSQTVCQRWAKEVFGTNSKGSQSSRRRSRFSSGCLIRSHGINSSRYLTKDTRRIARAMQGVSGLIR
ncbi:hypothetical protein IFHNHDMJ_01716 [Synechococcus sp. CBW1107]|nr:hypothetical protein IFHNHDMJ_01716 [Synechococcus sp. CBW1107]